MTIILDPGNQTESYNATPGRMWRTSAGLWRLDKIAVDAALAAMTTDRNTWQGRANLAWGVSDVWNSGESWEAAYARVLPPVGDVFWTGTGSFGPLTGSFQSVNFTESADAAGIGTGGTAVTISRTGNYVITCRATGSYGVGNGDVNLRILVNGGDVTGTRNVGGCRTWDISIAHRTGVLAGGFTVAVQAFGTGGTTTGISATLEITQIPNQTNPH